MRPARAAVTRHDLLRGCAACGHHEFIEIERGGRDAMGQQLEVDAERCERCGKPRHA